jgi:hypothetical protein
LPQMSNVLNVNQKVEMLRTLAKYEDCALSYPQKDKLGDWKFCTKKPPKSDHPYRCDFACFIVR